MQTLTNFFVPGNHHGIEIVTWTQEGARLYSDATSLEADAILLDPTIPGFEPTDIQRLYHYERKPIVTIGAIPPSGDWGSKLYQLGIKGHVDLPLAEAQAQALVGMIHRAVQDALRERASPSYIPQVDTRVAQVIATHGWEKSVVSIFSAKGGVGKSTTAENLAACLGVLANRRTILIDANMAGGNVHIHLGLRDEQIAKNIAALARRYHMNLNLAAAGARNPTHNVGILSAPPLLTPNDLYGHLTLFKNNLWVLPGLPKQYMAGEEIFQGDLGRAFTHELITTASSMADFVIIDLGQDINAPVHLQAIYDSNYVYVIVNPDAASVRATGEVLDTLFKVAQLDRRKFRLVVNKFHEEHGIRRKDIVDALQMPEVGVIPDGGPKVTASLNRGFPLVVDSRGEIARQYVAIAATLYPPVAQIFKHAAKLTPENHSLTGKLARVLLGG